MKLIPKYKFQFGGSITSAKNALEERQYLNNIFSNLGSMSRRQRRQWGRTLQDRVNRWNNGEYSEDLIGNRLNDADALAYLGTTAKEFGNMSRRQRRKLINDIAVRGGAQGYLDAAQDNLNNAKLQSFRQQMASQALTGPTLTPKSNLAPVPKTSPITEIAQDDLRGISNFNQAFALARQRNLKQFVWTNPKTKQTYNVAVKLAPKPTAKSSENDIEAINRQLDEEGRRMREENLKRTPVVGLDIEAMEVPGITYSDNYTKATTYVQGVDENGNLVDLGRKDKWFLFPGNTQYTRVTSPVIK